MKKMCMPKNWLNYQVVRYHYSLERIYVTIRMFEVATM